MQDRNRTGGGWRRRILGAGSACALVAAAYLFVSRTATAQEPYQYESDLEARHRVFRDIGAGFREIRPGPDGSYYILTAPATSVFVYDSSGKRTGQVPGQAESAAKGAALVYGESFDVDRTGRVVVCDRGANAVKVYSPAGSLSLSIPVKAPISVVFLPGDEFAVVSLDSDHLVTAYDLTGKVVREYGDREEIGNRADVNTQVNYGHLADDDSGNNYFSFDYLPEPTVRKFDRVGYLALEISLKTLEFQPGAQAARKSIARTEESENTIPSLHRIISAVGVDPQSQELWIAVGTLLMRFDKDGQRISSFRTYLPYGARVEPSQVLVEAKRLLIGSDPQGIYEFPKPETLPQ